MSERRGFFSFFTRSKAISEEEKQQRDYALEQTQKEAEATVFGDDFQDTTTEAPRNTTPTPLSDFCKQKLEEILRLSGFTGQVELVNRTETSLFFDIVNDLDTGRLIGKDGVTLEALQTLLKAFSYKALGESMQVVIDAGDYRKKREQTLRAQAIKAAKQVIENGRKAELRPMNATERRMVHMLFQNDTRIRSFSVGDGLIRHVVLEKRKG
ncbi:MAG: protein jag [Candidatus Margulisiibacteriota bacterium]